MPPCTFTVFVKNDELNITLNKRTAGAYEAPNPDALDDISGNTSAIPRMLESAKCTVDVAERTHMPKVGVIGDMDFGEVLPSELTVSERRNELARH